MIEIFTDGACETNPGTMGIGFIITDNKDILIEYYKNIGNGTNNIAEYRAVIKALENLISNKLTDKSILYSDSFLIINQINRKWKVKHPLMLELFKEVMKLKTKLPNITFQWIPREQNEKADFLSKKAIYEIN